MMPMMMYVAVTVDWQSTKALVYCLGSRISAAMGKKSGVPA